MTPIVLSLEEYLQLGQALDDKLKRARGRPFQIEDAASIQLCEGVSVRVEHRLYGAGIYVPVAPEV